MPLGIRTKGSEELMISSSVDLGERSRFEIEDVGCLLRAATIICGMVVAIEKRWELRLWDKVVCDITNIHVI